MSPLPLSKNEEDRLAALESYHIFDTGEEKDFDVLTSLASVICQIPIALITFINEKHQWFKSHHGTNLTANLRELSFCTHAIASSDEILIIPDATLDERFANNPMVTGPTKLAFYAGVPLINEDGYALGTLCVLDQQTHTLSEDQIAALKTLAKQVVDKIELRRKVLILERTNQNLLNSNMIIQKFASMAAHDIKNPLSSILLTSQALKIRHEKIQDDGCLKLVDMNINATKTLLELFDDMLEYSRSPSLLLEKKQNFELNNLILKVLELISIPENIQIILPEERHHLYLSFIAFEQIMINLLSNAIRYNNKEKGIIKIRFENDENFYRFEIEDNGIGIAEQYYEKIFDSNFTLKIPDRYDKKGSGIGLSTVKDLIAALKGTIYVKSTSGDGATFFIDIKK
ncbi:sensor histidine kinase [Arcticibacter eurypsychrophilus]|uniref:sensor histidine kinase n=1 Tax=Arcticibacter eurypsychrophilus TaxID=1434752 RepID=UPI00084DA696|nr:GAF domain-containing sensor histidine kinase [Arcticibacter eurypsychrophilus]